MSKLYVNELHPKTTGSAVLMPKQPRFSVLGNNGNYVTTSPVPFPTVLVDSTNSWSTSSNSYIVPVAGDYYFNLNMGIVRITASNGFVYIQLKINGSQKGYSYFQQTASGGGNLYGNLSIALMHPCAVGDEIQITDGGSTNAGYSNHGTDCRFSGFLLG